MSEFEELTLEDLKEKLAENKDFLAVYSYVFCTTNFHLACKYCKEEKVFQYILDYVNLHHDSLHSSIFSGWTPFSMCFKNPNKEIFDIYFEYIKQNRNLIDYEITHNIWGLHKDKNRDSMKDFAKYILIDYSECLLWKDKYNRGLRYMIEFLKYAITSIEIKDMLYEFIYHHTDKEDIIDNILRYNNNINVPLPDRIIHELVDLLNPRIKSAEN